MRKAISLVISAIMISSSLVPTFAQKRQAGARLTATPAESTLISTEQSTEKLAAQPTVKQKQNPKTASTQFGNFSAYTDGRGVWLSWDMEAEVGNIGFFAYRIGKDGPQLLAKNKGIIPGSAAHVYEMPLYGQRYSYYDSEGAADSAYYVEALSLTGSKVATGQIYPRYIPDLKTVTGLSPEEVALRGESQVAPLESNFLNLPKDMADERASNDLAPNPTNHRTVISQIGVARIAVKGEGFFRVTRAQLEAAGFDTNTISGNWQLYLEGNEQAITVGPSDAYIEFYGKGTNTPETDIRKYFLVNGSAPGKRIASRVASPSKSTVVSNGYSQTFFKTEKQNYLDSVINGEPENYFGRGFNSIATTINFNLAGIDTSVSTATLRVKCQGYSLTAHQLEVTLNNQLLGTVDPLVSNKLAYTASFTVPTSLLQEGANALKLRAAGPGSDFSFFDNFTIDFSRKFVAEQNRLSFTTQNLRMAKLSGFSSPNIRVFDMTSESEPIRMTNLNVQPTGGTFGVTMPGNRGRIFYAVEDSAILAPDSVTPNNPELVGIPTNGADLVIVAYKDLIPQAQVWANYRIGQGISVKIVDVEELFDEFNYGTFGAAGVKGFLQYAYQNWSNPPEYALLIGDGSTDSRNYEGLGNFNFIPSRIVSTVYSETASDEALADFNNDGLAEIAIGRISARTGAEVTVVYNKLLQWEALPADQWTNRGAVFAFDNDDGYPFGTMSQTLRNQIPMMTTATMVFRGAPNSSTTLLNALNTGPYIANYSGHGSAGSWGGSPIFFNFEGVAAMTNSNPSVYTMLTCLNGYFHWLYYPSMAEELLFASNKGAVVAWASSGLTTPDVQEEMATRFYQKVGQGTIPRMGDLVKDAKTVLSDHSDVRYSWVLLGDPMTKVR